MERLTFKGGVHPPGSKSLTAAMPIKAAPVPSKVYLPLIQHTGAVLEPLVKPGDAVKLGQKIADSKSFVSAPLHSSVSGKVLEIKPFDHPAGKKVGTIIIENDGQDSPDPSIENRPDFSSMSAKEIKSAVREAGIVGMGGAAFPTHVKLSPPDGKKIECLIINGVECEPYLTADHRLMLERPDEIISGVKLVMRALGVGKAFLAVESNKPDAVGTLEKSCSGDPSVETVVVRTKYPQGSEKQLIEALTGRQVPIGGLPMDVGVVVQNVATCVAVHEAVSQGRPLYRRALTVTGSNIARPGNFEVRLGTQVSELIALCGGLKSEGGKLILGGPMMGIAVGSDCVPVIKGTSGILALTEGESGLPDVRDCIRCGMCWASCPLRLTPSLIARAVELENFEEAKKRYISSCMECGTCSYVCPSGRPLVQWIKNGKFEILKKKPHTPRPSFSPLPHCGVKTAGGGGK